MENKYVSGKEASEILGVCQKTLHLWDKAKKIETIRTPGKKRLYNVNKFLKNSVINTEKSEEVYKEIDSKTEKLNISYARVSSQGQIDDLVRQKELIHEKYPNHLLIEDIGSGINLNKRGIRKIINLAIGGKINELVIAYKDRLTRYGYELIEDLIKEYSNGKIIIINKKDDLEPEAELVYDVLQIMNVFVAKMNGLRKYKNKVNKIVKKS